MRYHHDSMNNFRPRVVITHRVHGETLDLLRGTCDVVANETNESWPAEILLDLAADAQALMVFMPDSIDDAFLARCPQLKIIAGALKGYDNFDVSACSRRGVWFTISPDFLSIPTAELALALILGLTRNISPGDRLIRSGEFKGWRPQLYGAGLYGRTIGIIGMGNLGRTLVALLAGFQTRILYADPVALSADDERRLKVTRVELTQLLSDSQVIVAMAPLTKSTFHLLNKQTLEFVQPGSFLVNVGRGSVVDETAVVELLNSGRLAGYAADVFEMEDWALKERPRQIEPGLIKSKDRTLLTPHLGSAVTNVRLKIELAAATSILQALRGEVPDGAVNDIR